MVIYHCVFACISLRINAVEHFWMYLWAICIPSFENVYLELFCIVCYCSFLKEIFIYSNIRVMERGKERQRSRERERSSISWFTPGWCHNLWPWAKPNAGASLGLPWVQVFVFAIEFFYLGFFLFSCQVYTISNIFSHYVNLLFTLLIIFFVVHNLISLVSYTFGAWYQNKTKQKSCSFQCPMLFSSSPI